MPPSLGLASVIELAEPDSTSISVTPQPAIVRVGVTDSTGSNSHYVRTDDIRPLMFGAAWKILDLLIELALEEAGIPHDLQRNYSITFKSREAAAGNVAPRHPFDTLPEIWSRIQTLYARTEVLRNSLVHRRIMIDPATGAITGSARPLEPPPAVLTIHEQAAFCQVAVGVANGVITGQVATRRVDQLRWVLDQLTLHHGDSPFGASPATGLIPRVILRPPPATSGDVTLDFTRVRARARAAVSDLSHYDLELHLPDGRVLAGALEDAPGGTVSIAVDRPPGWLRWV
jgi:hypothetical protein